MLGKKDYQEALFIYDTKHSDLVPEDDFYRQLLGIINLDFVYPLCKDLYGTEGNPSLDPVVFFKLELVALFEGIHYDRQLMRRVKDSISLRFFLKYNLSDSLPWHSTISRTRRRIPVRIYKEVFRYILKCCVESGLVDGELQAVDSSYFKANASRRSLRKKEVDQLVGRSLRYRKQSLKKNKDDDPPSNQSCEDQRKRPSNQTHVSKTDPDSRLMSGPELLLDLYHKGTISVDSKRGVITSVICPRADISDLNLLPSVLAATIRNLGGNDLIPQAVVTDKGFVQGSVLKWVEDHGIIGFLPSQKHVNNRGKLGIEHFRYYPEGDYFLCPQGTTLNFKSINESRKQRVYRAKGKNCHDCPIRSECTDSQRGRAVTVSIYQEYYQRMAEIMSTTEGKQALTKRSYLVESVFGFWKQFGGLAKIAPRGQPQAYKKFLMAGCVHNAKKLVKCVKNGGKTPDTDSFFQPVYDTIDRIIDLLLPKHCC
jgi:transposase